ncbi:MAG: glycosyltransferase family 39 protein [Syntrophobacteraceae bacterium]|nr:glycosyltransferase family 39 protein [Syntrophobacteraceae bacterium]
MAINSSAAGSPGAADDSGSAYGRRQTATNWNKRFVILIGLVTLFRLVYLVVSPLSLAADEAYYWDWSRRLAWGYFSKPPMVAWIIGAFTRAFGSTTAAVRLPSVVLGTISSLAVFLLARRMYDARTAFWAAAVGMASPGAAALGYIMTIDAPLMCFWALGLYFFWAGVEKKEGGFGAWAGLAVVIGLGLLSKQVMGGFIVLMFVFVAVSKEDRRLLKSPRLYLVCLLGLAALLPDVLWNVGHGWITLHHTETHFAGSRSAFFLTFADFIGGQIALISPITWLLFVTVAGISLARFKSLDKRSLYLLTFSLVPLSGIAALSLRQKIQPNWPAAVYTAGIVLLAAWGCGKFSGGSRLDAWRPYFKKGIIVGAVMALCTYGLPFWAAAVPGRLASKVADRVEGWKHFGRQAGRALGDVPSPQRTFLLTFDRKLAAELAFYVPGHPRVYVWRAPGAPPTSQYDLWEGPKAGLDALIICPASDAGADTGAVSGYFGGGVKPLAGFVGGDGHRRYSLYLGSSLKKWPAK